MEALCRSESSGIALDLVLMSLMESAVREMVLEAGKSLFWHLCLIGSTPSRADLFGEGCEIIKGFPLSSLRSKGESMPENKDDGESDDDDGDSDEDEGGEQDDDGGEDYSGDEGNEEDDEDDELEPNGGGDRGAGGSDDDEDDDDDDEDEDGEDDDDDEDEEDEEDQPPPKKRK